MLITSFLVAIVAHGVWKWPFFDRDYGRRIIFDPGRQLRIGEHPQNSQQWLVSSCHGRGVAHADAVVGAGRGVALERREENAMLLETFIWSLSGPGSPQRSRARLSISRLGEMVPAAPALNHRHKGVLHELVVVMKGVTERSPRVAETERMLVENSPLDYATSRSDSGLPKSRMYWPRVETSCRCRRV
jgi:KUP system potassium uptake protein